MIWKKRNIHEVIRLITTPIDINDYDTVVKLASWDKYSEVLIVYSDYTDCCAWILMCISSFWWVNAILSKSICCIFLFLSSRINSCRYWDSDTLHVRYYRWNAIVWSEFYFIVFLLWIMFNSKRIIKIKFNIHKIYKIVSNATLCFDVETAAFCPVYMKRSLQRKIPFTLDQLFIKGGVARYAQKNTTPCILWCTCRYITHHSIYRAETCDIW